MAERTLTVFAILGKNVLSVFEVYECPVLGVSFEYDMASPAPG